MADVFSTRHAAWTYKARVPSILRTTKLPLPATTPQKKTAVSAGPDRDAAYWAENTKGFDFSAEDKLDSDRFNLVLWNGLKGDDQPYPSGRSGRDLRKHRAALLRELNKSKDR
jgi:hypothetical protein